MEKNSFNRVFRNLIINHPLLNILRTILILWLLAFCATSFSQNQQRYNTFSYNVNEGLLQSTIGNIEVDKDNFCWITFPNGIQKFDGKNFTPVPVQPGLPDDKLASLFRCKNGDLLISHAAGVSLYQSESNSFRLIYQDSAGQVAFIGEDGGLIYFYTPDSRITGISSSNYAKVTDAYTGIAAAAAHKSYMPLLSDNIVGNRIAFFFYDTLCLWDLKAGKLLYKSGPVSGASSFILHLSDENKVLFRRNDQPGTLQVYDFASTVISSFPIAGAEMMYISRCRIFPWKDKLLISINERLFETDSSLHTLRSELVNFQNTPITGGSTIAAICDDNFGNLYIQTVTGGIRKVIRNNYPVNYYSTPEPGQHFVLCVFPDKTLNRVFAGTTGNGLLVYDTLQRLVRKINITGRLQKPITPNAIFKTPAGEYLLFASGQSGCWLLSRDLLKNHFIPFSSGLPADKRGTGYFANLLLLTGREALVQTQDRIYRVDLQQKKASEHLVANGYIMSGIFNSGQVLLHVNDELLWLDIASWKVSRRLPLRNTGYVRCYARNKEGHIYIGSNKGIFIMDSGGRILSQINRSNGLPDECIYAMAFDKEGQLWCSTNKGILKIVKGNTVLQLTKDDGLQENEFNTNCVAVAADGELFFGGTHGFNSFHPQLVNPHQEKLSLLFTRLRANNEDLFNDPSVRSTKKLVLPYTQNALSFDFVAMGNYNPDQYQYQYRMEGVDKEWIQNNSLQTVRYVLPPGEYTFSVFASRSFHAEAQPLEQLHIIIRAPFWKTIWFRLGIGLLLLVLLAYIINQGNKRKYEKQLQLLEQEKQLQQERERISKDLHDSLGAYANAVLYNTELLEKGQGDSRELITGLKYVSKDIITTLRETVWALKKDSFTYEECLVRIRNFVQPLARYYPHIQFHISGEVPEGQLNHVHALNLVRVVQEALTNSIKHAGTASIRVESLPVEQKWMLRITDYGKGFDYPLVKSAERGNGLSNMEQRAAVSGFSLTITSTLNKGTCISVLI